MNLDIKGKTAVVAGSSRGLGRAVAETLAAEGVHLVLCSRSKEAIKTVAREIQDQFGVEVWADAVDVRHENEVQRLVSAGLDKFGRVDILVTNAGGPPATRFAETETAEWREGIDLNLMSTIFLCRAVVPSMRRERWGRIVAITSVAVKQPIDGLVLSNVARLGVLGLTKTMAAELAPHGITVNTVCPGYTRTDRLEELARQIAEKETISEQAVYDRWTDLIPMGRLGRPEEFAAMVAFLVSERASYVTGTCIQIDGGFVRGVL